MTDTIHDRTNAAVMTGNRAYKIQRPPRRKRPTGMKPAQVMRVPVSIGFAVARKA